MQRRALAALLVAVRDAQLDAPALAALATEQNCYAAQVIVDAVMRVTLEGYEAERAAINTLTALGYVYTATGVWTPPPAPVEET